MTHISRLTRDHYDDIFALSQFAFQYQLSEEVIKRKKEEADSHQIWGWIEEENLAAKLHIIPLHCFINGKEFEMGGISSVATWPEYRRNGIVKKLLFHALDQMKQNGQTISFLHPFSFPFYRKYGWELTFVNKAYSIPMEKLAQNWPTDGYVRRIKDDIPLLQSIYTDYAKKFSGMLTRDARWWKYRVFKEPFQTAVSYDNDGNANGYIIYQVKNEIFSVQEIVDLTLEAKKTLFRFIANHDSMAEKVELTVPESDNLFLLLDEPKFKQEIVSYFMARIVDVESFLRQYPFLPPESAAAPFTISVKDEFLEENNGVYAVDHIHGINRVSKQEKKEHNITCSVQQLTVMLLGYKRPYELVELGLITGSNEAVSLLDQLIPEQQTFLTDFF